MNFSAAFGVTLLGGFASDAPNDLGAEPGMAARFS
jgi:hypothetical protein